MLEKIRRRFQQQLAKQAADYAAAEEKPSELARHVANQPNLYDNMGVCPRCQRLRILPCSSCDPNQ